jgi:hypothetical protein
MPHCEGQIEKVYHNYVDKQGNKLPDYKVNHKIKMNGELYIIKGKWYPPFVKDGARVSFSYNVWKQPSTGMDLFYIMKDEKTNKLLIQSHMKEDNPENDLDDQLDNGGNGFAAPTDFDANALETQGTNPQVLKEQQIFVTALLKSSIENGQINVKNREDLDKSIIEFKDLYNKNFKQ